jgi:transposase
MTNLAYHTLIRASNEPEVIRHALVERYYALGKNASACALEYNTKRQTVTRWVKRFETLGSPGLKNLPTARHTPSPHKSGTEIEQAVITIAKGRRYRIGQDRVRLELPPELKRSTATINRIMHEHDLIKKRKRKHQKKQQCAQYKKTLRALRNWQVDVKELRDIPNVVALVEAGIIPNYEYTARDQVTGTTFICYGWEHTLINSVRFVSILFEHLRSFGIHGSEVIIQTDNGSEFIGSIYAKERSLFTTTIEDTYRGIHRTIPVGRKEYQGVVESFHGRVEYEFYDVEEIHSLSDFLSKAHTFIVYWNLKRRKLENQKSPFTLIKEKCQILDTQFCVVSPCVLDSLHTFAHHYGSVGVPYVGDEVKDLPRSFWSLS